MTDNPILSRSWSKAWTNNSFKIQFLGFISVLILLIVFMPQFFIVIQQRNGYRLNDYLLNLFPAANLSALTFSLIYSSVIIAVFSFSFYPWLLLRTLQSYCTLLMIRIICIWAVPLNEPANIIMLNDPFIDAIGYGGKAITKDLFFSGHTATLFLLFLNAVTRWLKIFLLVMTVAVAVCVLIQHVHYAIDVLAAPFFSWLSYKIFIVKPGI